MKSISSIKRLKIFAWIFTLLVLSVSCEKENSTSLPHVLTPEVKADLSTIA